MKRMIALLMCIVLSLNVPIRHSMASDGAPQDNGTEMFRLEISCPDGFVDTSGIEIRVFSSSIAYEDEEIGYAEYSESYAFSVYPDCNGAAFFERPSDCFSLSLNLDTLPVGYGVDNHTRFFFPETSHYQISLAEISSVQIDCEDEVVVPILKDIRGDLIFAEATVQSNGIISLPSIDTTKHLIDYSEEYIVDVQGVKYPYIRNISCSYANDYEKAEYLYQHGFITQYEYIKQLSAYVVQPCESDLALPSQVDGTELYWKIRNYLESEEAAEHDCTLIEAAMRSFDPEQGRSLTYVTSNSGHFRVYYESTEITSTVASAVAAVFDSVDAKFYSSWGFRRPYYDTSTSYYKVYLVNTNAYAGETPLVGTEGSYINISYTTAACIANNNGISGYPYAYHGVVAHEYMHAIFYRYGIMYDTSERQWMHEAFASWAGIAYKTDYAAYASGRVNQFTSTPYETLTYFSSSGNTNLRHYGACVFPLYIQQQLGGYTRIKKILSDYSSSNNPLTAINTGLSYYGSSLSEAFSGCASFNYAPSYFYSGVPNSGNQKWNNANANTVESYPYSSPISISQSKLSCRYTKFNAPGNYGQTLTMTIEYSYIPSGGVAVFKTVRETSDGSKYISNRTISNNRCTVVQYNFGNSVCTSMTAVPINAGNVSGTVSYMIYAALQ